MIRSARRRHRLIWLLLAVILPLLLAAGVIFRHAEPVNENVPEIIGPQRIER